MDSPLLLGIDLGTTTCRAAVLDLDGREVASAALENTISYPRPLWAEMHPETWWDGVVQVVRQTLAAAALPPRRITSVGISGLMHAPVLLDDHGVPVSPAMLWMDQRCAPQCLAIKREAAAASLPLTRDLGTSHTGPKLRWLAEIQPEVLARAHALMLPKDYIRFRLTGVPGTDPSDAGGTGLFDRQAGGWHQDLADLCRVPRHLLPQIRPSDSLAGTITPQAAAATGLAPGTPVAMGGADTFCTRLGAGPLAAGEACLYLGTAAWIAMIGYALPPGESPAAADSAAPPGRPVTRAFGATSTTGAALRWLRDLFGPPDSLTASATRESYDSLIARAALAPPGADGLFFLPHLMGERGPAEEPLARGALVGLTLRHGPGHLARAVIEGTAFQIRRVIEGRAGDAPPLTAVVSGGAARSPLWMQILADVTNLPLRVPEVLETAALGAAILGGAAAGLFTPTAAQQRMVRAGQTYAPVPHQAARYAALYSRYCRLDDLLAPWFRDTANAPHPLASGNSSAP